MNEISFRKYFTKMNEISFRKLLVKINVQVIRKPHQSKKCE